MYVVVVCCCCCPIVCCLPGAVSGCLLFACLLSAARGYGLLSFDGCLSLVIEWLLCVTLRRVLFWCRL